MNFDIIGSIIFYIQVLSVKKSGLHLGIGISMQLIVLILKLIWEWILSKKSHPRISSCMYGPVQPWQAC